MSKLKNIGYTFVGNVTFSMIKWLILILIVKLTTPEQVGNYTFAMALTAPIILFTNMRLRLRYVVEDNLTFNNVRILRNVLNVFSILIILVVGAILFPQYLSYIILVAFTKILDLQSELYYAILHKKQNFKLISLMIKFFLFSTKLGLKLKWSSGQAIKQRLIRVSQSKVLDKQTKSPIFSTSP